MDRHIKQPAGFCLGLANGRAAKAVLLGTVLGGVGMGVDRPGLSWLVS